MCALPAALRVILRRPLGVALLRALHVPLLRAVGVPLLRSLCIPLLCSLCVALLALGVPVGVLRVALRVALVTARVARRGRVLCEVPRVFLRAVLRHVLGGAYREPCGLARRTAARHERARRDGTHRLGRTAPHPARTPSAAAAPAWPWTRSRPERPRSRGRQAPCGRMNAG
jgi:hypothetical protein